MFHVSFRYIFGIPPLILVLLPVASSDCDIEGKDGREYQHILMISINDLDTMIKNRTNCPNNEPNVLKKHACDDNKEAVFLYRAAHKLKHFVKVNNSEDFNLHLSRVSQGTLQLLNCTSKGLLECDRTYAELLPYMSIPCEVFLSPLSVGCTGRQQIFKGTEKTEELVFPRDTTTKDKNLLE